MRTHDSSQMKVIEPIAAKLQTRKSEPAVSMPFSPDDLQALREKAGVAAALLKALANPDRLLLLCQLVAVECHVSELEQRTGISQPTLSQQLGILREQGLVEVRRDGKYNYYSVTPGPALAVLQTLYNEYCAPERPNGVTDAH